MSTEFMERMEARFANALTELCPACAAMPGAPCETPMYAVHTSRLIAAETAGRDPGDEDYPDILASIGAADRWNDKAAGCGVRLWSVEHVADEQAVEQTS
jgi:hypothetical protein